MHPAKSFAPATLPLAWGVQPDDEPDTTWNGKWYQEGGLRAPTEVESGGPVRGESGTHSGPQREKGYHDAPRRQRGGRFAGCLIQCWCGRSMRTGTYEMVRAGETFTCDYYRCRQIADMSPAERLNHRPRQGVPRRPRRTTNRRQAHATD